MDLLWCKQYADAWSSNEALAGSLQCCLPAVAEHAKTMRMLLSWLQHLVSDGGNLPSVVVLGCVVHCLQLLAGLEASVPEHWIWHVSPASDSLRCFPVAT